MDELFVVDWIDRVMKRRHCPRLIGHLRGRQVQMAQDGKRKRNVNKTSMNLQKLNKPKIVSTTKFAISTELVVSQIKMIFFTALITPR